MIIERMSATKVTLTVLPRRQAIGDSVITARVWTGPRRLNRECRRHRGDRNRVRKILEWALASLDA